MSDQKGAMTEVDPVRGKSSSINVSISPFNDNTPLELI